MPIGCAAFLDGGREMDEHFTSAPFDRNLPVLLGLIGVWNRSFLGIPSHAVLPYDQRRGSDQQLTQLPTSKTEANPRSSVRSIAESSALIIQRPLFIWTQAMNQLSRITTNPRVMGGKPCLRGQRVTVGTVVGLVAAGRSPQEILGLYPYLELGDIYAALAYAAWRTEEIERPLTRESALDCRST